MKKMKKPTLKQLKKRPALWFLVSPDKNLYCEMRITMPNGDVWSDTYLYTKSWYESKNHWHMYAKRSYEFVGWL